MERPLAEIRPFGPVMFNQNTMPRPEPPEAGRRERRSKEEIMEFMDMAYDHPWTEEYAREYFRGIANMDPDSNPEHVNFMKVSAAAGIIGSDNLESRRSPSEIAEMYIEERNINVP